MSAVEDRLAALESEVRAVKRQLAKTDEPRPRIEDVAGSMDAWPEFEEVLRLGRAFRRSVREESGNGSSGE